MTHRIARHITGLPAIVLLLVAACCLPVAAAESPAPVAGPASFEGPCVDRSGPQPVASRESTAEGARVPSARPAFTPSLLERTHSRFLRWIRETVTEVRWVVRAVGDCLGFDGGRRTR